MILEAALTANRRRVLETLRTATAPLGACGILKRLQECSIRAPLQVYRALDNSLVLSIGLKARPLGGGAIGSAAGARPARSRSRLRDPHARRVGCVPARPTGPGAWQQVRLDPKRSPRPPAVR